MNTLKTLKNDRTDPVAILLDRARSTALSPEEKARVRASIQERIAAPDAALVYSLWGSIVRCAFKQGRA